MKQRDSDLFQRLCDSGLTSLQFVPLFSCLSKKLETVIFVSTYVLVLDVEFEFKHWIILASSHKWFWCV